MHDHDELLDIDESAGGPFPEEEARWTLTPTSVCEEVYRLAGHAMREHAAGRANYLALCESLRRIASLTRSFAPGGQR